MKILVSIKWVIDPNVKIRLKIDQSGVESSHVKMSLNPFDAIALEEALRLKEQGHCEEVVVVNLGPRGNQEGLRIALAMGADRGVQIETESSLPPLWVAKALKALVEREKPSLVMLGKQSIDGDHNQTGQMLAALLDWPQGTFVSHVQYQDPQWLVTRETDDGLETLRLELPAVMTSDLRLNEPRYPTLPNILKSKQKNIQTWTLSDLGVEPNNHYRVIRLREPVMQKTFKKMHSVEDLVEILKPYQS